MIPFVLLVAYIGGPNVFITYFWWIVLTSYAHSALYLTQKKDGEGIVQRFKVFLLAPAYGMLAVFILAPLRVWSLIKIGDNSWGTRKDVEVSSLD
jgi:hyaluronan synthase